MSSLIKYLNISKQVGIWVLLNSDWMKYTQIILMVNNNGII